MNISVTWRGLAAALALYACLDRVADAQAASDVVKPFYDGSGKALNRALRDSAGDGCVTSCRDEVVIVNPAGSPVDPSAPSSSGAITNPASTLTLPSTTTAYAAGNLIASSATAGSVVVPSFAIANSAGGAVIAAVRLASNDATSTSWGGQTVRVDLWLTAPTFTNGDRGAFAVATGTAAHLRSFTCVMSPAYGDGTYAECAPDVASVAMPKLASGTSVYWTATAVSGSGVTGASKAFTLTPELLN